MVDNLEVLYIMLLPENNRLILYAKTYGFQQGRNVEIFEATEFPAGVSDKLLNSMMVLKLKKRSQAILRLQLLTTFL